MAPRLGIAETPTPSLTASSTVFAIWPDKQVSVARARGFKLEWPLRTNAVATGLAVI